MWKRGDHALCIARELPPFRKVVRRGCIYEVERVVEDDEHVCLELKGHTEIQWSAHLFTRLGDIDADDTDLMVINEMIKGEEALK